MSKNLEMEYKKQIQNNVPDLWDRIEAGLEEKKPVRQEQVTKPKRRKRPYIIGGGILAAGLCVAVALPVFTRNTKDYCASDAAASADIAMDAAEDSMKNAMVMENAAEELQEEAKKSNVLTIRVRIEDVIQTGEGAEYQALVMEEETGVLEKERKIMLRQDNTEDAVILELQKEYTIEVEESDGQSYWIQSIEKEEK